ncbi:hypothetical protein Tco_0557370 [Tanacetum coccineum]
MDVAIACWKGRCLELGRDAGMSFCPFDRLEFDRDLRFVWKEGDVSTWRSADGVEVAQSGLSFHDVGLGDSIFRENLGGKVSVRILKSEYRRMGMHDQIFGWRDFRARSRFASVSGFLAVDGCDMRVSNRKTEPGGDRKTLIEEGRWGVSVQFQKRISAETEGSSSYPSRFYSHERLRAELCERLLISETEKQALCYPKNDREDIGKLGAKGDIGFFVGYSTTSCAYRFKPELQGRTFGHISSGLELTYAQSTITPHKPTERDLELLFESMYDDYMGGQPSDATRTAPAAPATLNRQTPNASTTTA